MKRTLSLKREALTPLTSSDLAAIATASVPTWAQPGEVNSLDPLTTCFAAIRESYLCGSGTGCHTYDSDCSCRI